MINPNGPPDATITGRDVRRAPDERSMRILELGMAGMALVAAIVLAVVR
jgi:hypothetical protein